MKVGDYIRTKDGIIDKVIIEYNGKCASPNCNCKHVSCVHNYYDEDTIIKSSQNIIDLIEVGDYVNGCHITYIVEPGKYNSNRILYFEEPQDYVLETFTNEEIKSVVTKEQFEQMEYKIGDKNE